MLTERLGLDYPIYGFSHCRDVVAGISSSGGIGVLGTSLLSPEELDVELSSLERELDGRPYGVDLVFPARHLGDDREEMIRRIPAGHRAFVDGLVRRFDIPVGDIGGKAADLAEASTVSPARARRYFEVVLRHRPAMMVTALGPAPDDVMARAHEAGMVVGGLVGTPRHAQKQVAAGADFVISIGQEAGGHTGVTTTLVLVPQIVDAVPGTPVLAGGGVATGRQLAAVRALGAEGAWMGSVWLTTVESDTDPVLKERLLNASSVDAVTTNCYSGKTTRRLTCDWMEAWAEPGAPAPLPAPLQGLLIKDAMTAIHHHRMMHLKTTPVGQVVGLMNQTRSVRALMGAIAEEYVDTVTGLRPAHA